MAVQPLSPATDRRLGGPLPHQLPNRTRAHLSAIKSLIAKSCGFAMSCGISVRFRTLSPSERQVAHALLTRPPLNLFSFGRSLNPISSVRLACVRHAASVHPEPGSNSLKILYQSQSLNIILRALIAQMSSDIFFLVFTRITVYLKVLSN